MSHENGTLAAQAIMTTDTFAKQVAVRIPYGEDQITIGGMAKGAGMIHPNMATMLAVITTDAAVNAQHLQSMLKEAADSSFNRISVDGDTSTNDTILLLANGASGVSIEPDDEGATFLDGLGHVCTQLAQMIVRDAEGASKFVLVRIRGAGTENDAHAIANAVVTSPLVKTALAGSDANWGRILAAAGRAGVTFDQSRVALWVGNSGDGPLLQIVENGTPTEYTEADAAAIFAQDEIVIDLDLKTGAAQTTMWTCDLTHEYVTINADYRT
jgi:glutamate N-acetyltransferase/amino-acid N-acetyltransferase